MKQVLADVPSGCKARIYDISGVSEFVRRRLTDLGMTEQTEVCVKHFLPFGGPVVVESGTQRIGIRRKEARRIGVELT